MSDDKNSWAHKVTSFGKNLFSKEGKQAWRELREAAKDIVPETKKKEGKVGKDVKEKFGSALHTGTQAVGEGLSKAGSWLQSVTSKKKKESCDKSTTCESIKDFPKPDSEPKEERTEEKPND